MTDKDKKQTVLDEASREYLQRHSEQTLRIAAKKEQELFEKTYAIDYYFLVTDQAKKIIQAIKKRFKTK